MNHFYSNHLKMLEIRSEISLGGHFGEGHSRRKKYRHVFQISALATFILQSYDNDNDNDNNNNNNISHLYSTLSI